MSKILSLCDDLLRAYLDKGQDLSSELLPGISDQEIADQTAWFPAPLPAEVKVLFNWHNGQPNDAWNTEKVLWFRDMQFHSIERAKPEYESMMASYGAEDWDGTELRTCFPIASFNGGWLVVPCDGHNLGPRFPFPVICVFQGIDMHFHSIEKMLETCIEWRRASHWTDGSSTTKNSKSGCGIIRDCLAMQLE